MAERLPISKTTIDSLAPDQFRLLIDELVISAYRLRSKPRALDAWWQGPNEQFRGSATPQAKLNADPAKHPDAWYELYGAANNIRTFRPEMKWEDLDPPTVIKSVGRYLGRLAAEIVNL